MYPRLGRTLPSWQRLAAMAGAMLVVTCASKRPESPSTVTRADLERLVVERLGDVSRDALRPVSAFEAIEDETTRSAALFLEMSRVITHPRCTNCHPSDDSPRQGELGDAHVPPITRGPDGHGVPGLECATCHGDDHTVFVEGDRSLPGHARWALAPIEMAWAGVPLAAICKQLKDPQRNGGLSLDRLVEHDAKDELVGYGWAPGPGREPVPGTQQQFGELTRAWVDTGAVCPSDAPTRP